MCRKYMSIAPIEIMNFISTELDIKLEMKLKSSVRSWIQEVNDEVGKFWFNLESINEVGKLPLKLERSIKVGKLNWYKKVMYKIT